MKFSQWRCEARRTSSEWWAMLGSGVSVIRSSASRRISAASSAGMSLGSWWKRRSPRTSESTSSSRVERAVGSELAFVLVISGPFADLGVAQLRDRSHPEAEHTNLELLDKPPDSVRDFLRRFERRRQEGIG